MGCFQRSAEQRATAHAWLVVALGTSLLVAVCGASLPWWVAAGLLSAVALLGWQRLVARQRYAEPAAQRGGPEPLVVHDTLPEGESTERSSADRPIALARVPFTPINRIRDGQLAKFVGQVHLAEHEPLVAPLSGRRCAYYRARVGIPVVPRLFGGRGRRFRTIAEESQSQRFFVEDPTGRALVVVDRPRVLVTMRGGFSRHRSTRWRLQAFVERYGQSLGTDELRCEEGLLEPGDPVAVYGRCQWVPDPDPAARGGHYRARPQRLVVDAPVRISTGGLALE